ncbi:hypothetical protein GRAN_3938 [Granulicella sibirica]|uniref:Uncharacterized protein n=1 Tax=Granulicella sibirica TaxID=2479048 RepID=A0A4V1L580_9BACT|nr:hypothetical protein GRAN_3938 [Granulicella sibirica]
MTAVGSVSSTCLAILKTDIVFNLHNGERTEYIASRFGLGPGK